MAPLPKDLRKKTTDMPYCRNCGTIMSNRKEHIIHFKKEHNEDYQKNIKFNQEYKNRESMGYTDEDKVELTKMLYACCHICGMNFVSRDGFLRHFR